MKRIKFLAAAFVLALAGCNASEPAAPVAKANPPNVLEAYVAKPDPSFAWKVEKTFTGPGYRGVVIDLTSQTWLSEKETDRPVWKHWLTVTIPDHGTSARGEKIAVETSTVVAELGQTPNQPMRFADSPDTPRIEDDIIAHLWARYDEKANPEALIRLPMVKSGSAAMTAVQQFMATPEGGGRKIDGFVVSGGSKRAWTSWLVGLTDPRVVGIIPVVINVLDVNATTKHHWMAMGYFSPALQDYVNHRIVPYEIGGARLDRINAIEDPLSYVGRPQMKIPKFIINAVGDEYFPPDNTRYSYHLLPAQKQLRMLPNSRHSPIGTDINDSIIAWYDAVIRNQPIPEVAWTVRDDGALIVKTTGKPSEVLLWQGTNPNARDFRVDVIGEKAFTASPVTAQPDGSYIATVEEPASGFTGYFVELTYPSGTKYPFKFTTEVYVKPDILPYRWEDARPITAPDGK
jgi:PhoPQ-activated pathogenicity-related protein